MNLYRSKDNPNKWMLRDIVENEALALLCTKPVEGGTYAPLRIVRVSLGMAPRERWERWELSPEDEDVIANTLHHLLTRLV